MVLILDSVIFSLQKQGGISIYWKELLARICDNSSFDINLILYRNRNDNPNFLDIETQIKYQHKISIKRINSVFLTFLFRFFPKLILRRKKQIFHSSYLNVAYGINIKNVLTIHDMGYERKITQSGIRRKINILFKYFALRKADAIICISQFSKEELIHFYPFCKTKMIRVIYNGKSSEFYPLNKVQQKIVEGKYVIFVGTRYSYKRFDLVVEALTIKTDLKLVVVGGGKLSIRELANLNCKIGQRYLHFDNVTREQLNNLYNYSFALIYPSIYEGFGIPIVEAMSAGCPFIATNAASIPEVANGAGIILEKCSIESVIDALNKLEEFETRDDLIKIGLRVAEKYSWDKCYQETIQLYKDLHF